MSSFFPLSVVSVWEITCEAIEETYDPFIPNPLWRRFRKGGVYCNLTLECGHAYKFKQEDLKKYEFYLWGEITVMGCPSCYFKKMSELTSIRSWPVSDGSPVVMRNLLEKKD